MSIATNDNYSKITTQFGNDAIMFKKYHFGLRRNQKKWKSRWISTHKLCNATITIHEGIIVKTSFIKADGKYECRYSEKMFLHVYERIKALKRKIEEEFTPPVSLLYDQEAKKFRGENGSAAAILVFARVKSSLYEYWSRQHPPIPKSLSTVDVPGRLTRTLLGHDFLSSCIDSCFCITK